MPPKRKSDQAEPTSRSKRTRKDDGHTAAIDLVDAILTDPVGFDIPDDDDKLRNNMVALAQYARALEGRATMTSASAGGMSTVAPEKSPEELSADAERIRKAAVAGIKKQMTWKPTCKGNRATWSYDGICANPEVFGTLLGLGGPPKFKMKKMTKEEFEQHLGDIHSSARYNSLYITGSHVNIRWSETGEFKFSGTYGIGSS